VSAVATEYIELGLRLGRHVENLVDSYYGPKEISERVDAEEPREPSREVQRATESLNVGGNVAHMLHSDGCSLDEAREYLMRWALTSPERADQVLRFIADPMWRSYSITYIEGYRLCRDWVAGDPERFSRLLTEQLTSADLR